MIRLIAYLVVIGAFVYFALTVPLGKHTLYGHIRAIWHSEEAKDLRDGVKETAGPTVHKLEHGIEAGYDSVTKEGATRWLALAPLAVEAEVPACTTEAPSHVEPHMSVVRAAGGKPDCRFVDVDVSELVANDPDLGTLATLDAYVASIKQATDRTESGTRITRQDHLADGWIVEYFSAGTKWRVYSRVVLAGRTFVCTNDPVHAATTDEDIAAARRVCESLRAAK